MAALVGSTGTASGVNSGADQNVLQPAWRLELEMEMLPATFESSENCHGAS